MPQITAFTPVARKQDRYVLEVDGEKFATVSLELIERFGLHVGDPLLETVAPELLDSAAAVATFDRAVNMLSFRGRSARDLEKRLVQKGEERKHAEAAVEKLRSLGLIDDAAFARARARVKLTSGKGKRRVEADLRFQGVEKETAHDAVGQVIEESSIDMQEQANATALKKVRSLAKLEPAVRQRRLYAFLARRGYGMDEIKKAIAVALASLR